MQSRKSAVTLRICEDLPLGPVDRGVFTIPNRLDWGLRAIQDAVLHGPYLGYDTFLVATHACLPPPPYIRCNLDFVVVDDSVTRVDLRRFGIASAGPGSRFRRGALMGTFVPIEEFCQRDMDACLPRSVLGIIARYLVMLPDQIDSQYSTATVKPSD